MAEVLSVPIKPENRSRYPLNWKQIREQILERAEHRCEKCRVPNYSMIRRGKYEDRPCYWIHGESVARCEETGEELGTIAWNPDNSEQDWVKVVLTVAHLGMPAHLPVNLHVTGSTETDQIVEIVGLFMPVDTEMPEWNNMMHSRALSEFTRCSPAVRTLFIIPLPCSFSGNDPRSSIPHSPHSVSPEYAILTGWRLLGKPFEAASVTTESTTIINMPSADSVGKSAALACSEPKTAFAEAYGFVATGRRASFEAIRGLLCGNRKDCLTNNALCRCAAFSLATSNTGPLVSDPNAGAENSFAGIGTGFSGLSRVMGEAISASGTDKSARAFSWSGHTNLYHCDEYPENCNKDNLMALCQLHHLRHDHEHHRANAAETRRKRCPVPDMFG